MATQKDLLMKLLKGIETGDPAAAAVVNEDKYIQHNPQTHEGSDGLAVLFKRLSKTNPRVKFFRVFEDGDFAFAHNEYDFASLRVAFEVFRFENGQAVEHWDNIQPMRGPNLSGRSMLDGETEISDLEKTQDNRALVTAFANDILINRQLDRLDSYLGENFIQHNPDMEDGITPVRQLLEEKSEGELSVRYAHLHRVLAQGNFVLCMSEGQKNGAHTSFYDLFRVQDGKLVEHWDTLETIAPRAEWKNENGKF